MSAVEDSATPEAAPVRPVKPVKPVEPVKPVKLVKIAATEPFPFDLAPA